MSLPPTDPRSPDPAGSDALRSGADLHAFVRELYPIPRAITGAGVRETLARIGQRIPLATTEVPSGTRVLDWTIPDEWTIREAWIDGPDGRRIVDFGTNALHLMGYSEPQDAVMPLHALRAHLHTIPEHPDWIPYRSSPYRRDWGFCLPHRQLAELPEGDYRVRIDSSIAPGSLTLGECVLPGIVDDEVVFYAHTCHPSLCNDNLSGIAVAVGLASVLARCPRRLSYRFVFGPTTIGSVAWLALNEHRLPHIRHGLSLACLGDRGPLTYKASRRGDSDTDRIARHVIDAFGGNREDFTPYGYDERQFCSPGFDLPYGRLTRTPNGRFPEYHTSADDLAFVTPEALESSLEALLEIVAWFECNQRYTNLSPKGEPRLGPRGLFADRQGRPPAEFEHALLWLLNQSDGTHDLLSIAHRSGLSRTQLDAAVAALVRAGLLEKTESSLTG
jgi:aminopeptidase-like protein